MQYLLDKIKQRKGKRKTISSHIMKLVKMEVTSQ